MRKVLIDTSVWIEFLKGNKEYYDPMLDLFENAEIYTLELIFAELLQGVKSEREFKLVSDFFKEMRVLDQTGLIYDAGNFSRKERLITKGIGLIDSVIIYSSKKYRLELWTLDRKILNYLESIK